MNALIRNFATLVAFASLTLAQINVSAADIVIGQAVPLTGSLAELGAATSLGGKLYFDQVNAQGGVHGAKLKLVVRDDGYKVDETVRQVHELIDKDKAQVLFEIVGAGNVGALIKQNILSDAGIALVGARTGADSLRNPVNAHVFNTRASYRYEAAKIVRQIKQVGISEIGVLYQDDPFGAEGLAAVKEALTANGVKLAVTASYPKNTTNIEAASKTLLAANPQALIMVANTTAAAAFIKHFRSLGGYGMIFALSAVYEKELVKLVGKPMAQGIGIATATPYPYSATSKLVLEYQAALKKYAPRDTAPSYASLEGYIAAKVLVEGLRRAGPEPTRERIRNALEAMQHYDMGGFSVSYSPSNHNGTDFVDVAVMDQHGDLMR